MKIEMNVFGKNGRIMKTALASFLTLLVGGQLHVQKKKQKKRNKVSKT